MRPRATWEAPVPSSSGCWPPSTRDTQLLQQLSKLSEEEGDIESAARYQKQLNELAPSDDSATRLAQLYSRCGELEEAQAVWSKMAAGKSEAHRIFQAIDSLLAQKKAQPVLEVTESLTAQRPAQLGGSYRQALALMDLQKPADASRRFQAILDLSTSDDEKSALAKAWSRDPKLRAGGARSTTAASGQQGDDPTAGSDQPALANPHRVQDREPRERCQPRDWRRSGLRKILVRRGWRRSAGCSTRRSRKGRPRVRS